MANNRNGMANKIGSTKGATMVRPSGVKMRITPPVKKTPQPPIPYAVTPKR